MDSRPRQAEGHLQGWNHYGERLVAAARNGDAGTDEWAAFASGDALTAAEASLAVCQTVLRQLRPGDGSAQTPCAEFNVDKLVEHLVGSLHFLGAAGGVPAPTDQTGTPEVRVANAAQATIEAWRKRGLDGMVNLGQSEVPAGVAVDIILLELLVHAWDFAQAAHQAITVDDALSTYVLERGRLLIAPQMRDGSNFAEEIEVAPEADSLTRLAAFTGRKA